MKIITKKQPVYKSVIKKYIEIVEYETEDGRKFSKEEEAIQYENQLNYQKFFSLIKKVSPQVDIPNICDNGWYFASNENELNAIITQFGGLKQHYTETYINGFKENTLKVGDWITAYYEDGGDYRSTNNFYTLEYVRKQIEIFLKSFDK